ncbi:helix-turn-helix domain-containing protein [Ponticaulis koreensis]|uniref:MarR family transcriptional regulator n=1 Tax=Ponticaulis koreensis TaxID=1123045 RepID=UPI0003B4B8B8|nr:MarR family transcriptional regulator [Ponticaulis koreensis]
MEDRQPLIDWMDALEFYARDWDETFGSRSAYFTQEFWYMLVGCVRAHWAGNPLTVSQLAHTMKSGSNRTREERIKKAVDDGYLEKAKDAKDGRATVVIPTPELESLVTGHLQRTLEQVMSKFPKTGA